MKLRRNFLPKSLSDWCGFLFMLCVVFLFYWFELFVVIPDYYSVYSIWYWIHFVTGSFLMVNIVSNLLAVMFVDTSIFSVDVSSENTDNWTLCNSCNLRIPPRCWHCDTCNQCILKRDHHCNFSGCCIGYANHRFFMMFLTYLFFACVYSLYFNLFYIFTRTTISYDTILQVFFPVMFLLFGLGKPLNHIYVGFLVLNVVGVVVSGVLLHFHVRLVRHGSVSYEDSRNISKYNRGLKQNICNIFGHRWYLAWISPFVHSSLLVDGVHWDVETNASKIKFY